jgi:anti-sigma factor RsiW
MRDCPNAEMRDLLPDLVHRTLSDGDMARVTAHVASCAECREEVALLRSAAAALRERPAVNVAAIVRALPAPPAQAPRLVLEGAPPRVARPARAPAAHRRAWSRAGAVAAAAAAVLTVFVARDRVPGVVNRASTVPGAVAPESAMVNAAPTAARPGVPSGGTEAPSGPPATQLAMSLAGGPGDLTDGELEALIGELETIDALPRVEPEEHVDPLREGGEEFE